MFGFEYEIVKEFPEYFLDYQEHDDEVMRWTDRVISTSGEWSGNVYDFFYRAYNRLVQIVKTPFKMEGITRIDDTPVHKALREALANALTNANFYGRRGFVIHRYPDKITIANPGTMRISPSDARLGGDSDPRNKTLMKLFNLIDIGERSGSGVPSIFATWQDEGWPEPALVEQFNPDRTVLSLVLSQQNDKIVAIKSFDNEKKTKGELKKQAIIDYISEHEVGTSSELALLLEITTARVRVLLGELVDDGLIVAEGANRNRTYKLKSKTVVPTPNDKLPQNDRDRT
jgi:predicted HTH transcriptional regulator